MNQKRLGHILLLASLLLLFFAPAFSQDMKIADSLITVLSTEKLSKKEKSKYLNSLAYYHQDIDTSLFLANQALQIAKETGELVLQGEALEEISNIERRLGNNSKSLQASLKALQIYESLGLTERQAASYGQLANNSISNENYPSAIAYLKKARRIYMDSDKMENQIIIVTNLGEAYRLAGYLDSATTCFKEVVESSRPIRDDYIQGYSLGNLGMIYAEQNKFDLAKTNLNKAILTLTGFGDSYSTCVYLATLGEVFQKEGKLHLAEEKLLEALTIAMQNGLKEQIRDFTTMLSSFYETSENYSKALEFQKLFQVYQDSLVNKATIQKIEQLKSGYEIDKRETEIGLLSTINTKQKYLVFLLATGFFSLLLFAYLLYKGNQKIKKTNTILFHQKGIITKREQEKGLLLRELNHRVKNNLQMISSLLNLQSYELTGHPAREAILSGKNRVEALSLIHRKLYQEGVDTRIMIKEYIEELVLGLFQGYNTSFDPEFEIDNISIHVDAAVPLALIINELITNSLKYAYNRIDPPMLKVIILNKAKNELNIEVIDNGIGFSAKENKKYNSFGIKLTTSLIEQLDGTIEKLQSHGTHWKIKVKIV